MEFHLEMGQKMMGSRIEAIFLDADFINRSGHFMPDVDWILGYCTEPHVIWGCLICPRAELWGPGGRCPW